MPATAIACTCTAEEHGEQLTSTVYKASASKLANVLWKNQDMAQRFQALREYTGVCGMQVNRCSEYTGVACK